MSEERKFGLTVGGAFAVLGAVALWRGRHTTATVFFTLAAILIILGIAAPRTIPPIRSAWMRGSHAMSRVTTPIILGILYFLVLTPTALIRRALGKNAMRRRSDGTSHWIARENRHGSPEEMKRQF